MQEGFFKHFLKIHFNAKCILNILRKYNYCSLSPLDFCFSFLISGSHVKKKMVLEIEEIRIFAFIINPFFSIMHLHLSQIVKSKKVLISEDLQQNEGENSSVCCIISRIAKFWMAALLFKTECIYHFNLS